MMLNLMVAPYILLGRVRLKFFFFLGGWGWGLAPRNCREAEVAVILSLILVILLLFLEALGIIRVYFRTFCRWRNPFDDSFSSHAHLEACSNPSSYSVQVVVLLCTCTHPNFLSIKVRVGQASPTNLEA